MINYENLEEKIRSYKSWFYNIELNGVYTSPNNVIQNHRHETRKKHFFDPLARAGFFKGKRVLDLGCCSGFWSLSAIEAGAVFVYGCDAWSMTIEQAQLVFEVKKIPENKYSFEVADVFEVINRDKFEKSFDIVLCLGLFYHIKKPITLLEGIRKVNKDALILDTTVFNSKDAVIQLRPEGKQPLLESAQDRIVFVPSVKAIHWMMREIGYSCHTIKFDFIGAKGTNDYQTGERYSFACSLHSDMTEYYKNIEKSPEAPPETLIEYIKKGYLHGPD